MIGCYETMCIKIWYYFTIFWPTKIIGLFTDKSFLIQNVLMVVFHQELQSSSWLKIWIWKYFKSFRLFLKSGNGIFYVQNFQFHWSSESSQSFEKISYKKTQLSFTSKVALKWKGFLRSGNLAVVRTQVHFKGIQGIFDCHTNLKDFKNSRKLVLANLYNSLPGQNIP